MDCSTAFILYCFLFWSNRQPIQIHPLLQPLSPTPLHLSGVGCPDSWARVGQSVRATVHWGFSEAHFQQTSPESCSQHSVFFLHFLLSIQYNLLAPRWSQLTALSFWGLCCCSSRPRLFFFFQILQSCHELLTPGQQGHYQSSAPGWKPFFRWHLDTPS